MILLAVGWTADTQGRVYEGAITPDRIAPLDWAKFAADDDPAIQAARHWLGEAYGCR